MVRLKRVEQWPRELSAFLRERSSMPFVWGQNDCLMYPADLVLRLTGVDPAVKWRGKYSTEAEAKELLKIHGGVDGIITEGLGFRGDRNVKTGGRGDIVMVKTKWGITGGVIDDTGARFAVPVATDGNTVRMPLDLAWRVWRY